MIPPRQWVSLIQNHIRSGASAVLRTVTGKDIYRVAYGTSVAFPVIAPNGNLVTVLAPGEGSTVDTPLGRVVLTEATGAPKPTPKACVAPPPAPEAPRNPLAYLHAARDRYFAAMTPEERSQWARDIAARMPPEARSERSRRAAAALTPEQRSENARRGAATMSPEARSERARKIARSKAANRALAATKAQEAPMTVAQVEQARTDFPRQRVTCDDCKTAFVEKAAERGSKGEAQVRVAAQSKGWSTISGVDRCPDCEAKRKAALRAAKEAKTVTTPVQPDPQPSAEGPRQATPALRRAINRALDEAYDVEALRYRGGTTDATLASDLTVELGQPVLPGWVAEERERAFGPAGNEELDGTGAEVAALLEMLAGLDRAAAGLHADLAEFQKRLREFNEQRQALQARLAEVAKRQEALKAAIGPRARAA